MECSRFLCYQLHLLFSCYDEPKYLLWYYFGRRFTYVKLVWQWPISSFLWRTCSLRATNMFVIPWRPCTLTQVFLPFFSHFWLIRFLLILKLGWAILELHGATKFHEPMEMIKVLSKTNRKVRQMSIKLSLYMHAQSSQAISENTCVGGLWVWRAFKDVLVRTNEWNIYIYSLSSRYHCFKHNIWNILADSTGY